MNTITHVLHALLDLLFPPNARRTVYDTLPVERLAECAVRTHIRTPFTCLAPLPYKHELVRQAVLSAKFHGHRRAAELLGTVLAPFVAEELAERRVFGTFTDVLLIPVPLHHERQKERGYNQVLRITQSIYTNLPDSHLTLRIDVLVRHKATHAQTERATKQERYANMKGAFSVSDPEAIVGRDILLVDDVITTGATLESAKEALYGAGARTVLCIAVAH